MSPAEREALSRLVEERAAELEEIAGESILVSAGAVLRWLMIKEAKGRGIPTGTEPPPPPASEPPARVRPTKAPTPKASASKGKPAKGRK